MRIRPVGNPANLLVTDTYAMRSSSSITAEMFVLSLVPFTLVNSPLTNDASCNERAVETSGLLGNHVDSLTLGLSIESAASLS